jgi:peptide/nickel transport system ATP-binding protein
MAGIGDAHLRPADEVLLRVEHLVVEFPAGRRNQRVHAVTDVSIDVKEGETLGLVGESGCGKSTTGKAIMQLPPPTSGHVWFSDRDRRTVTADAKPLAPGEEAPENGAKPSPNGSGTGAPAATGTATVPRHDLADTKGEALRRLRTQIQMIFQDPISSLNPRRRVEDIIAEGLNIWDVGDKDSRAAKVDELIATVGMDPAVVRGRRPHQFSGGQCQRISIARAVATEPKLIICDEPVSALDVSVQAQILNLLEDMKARYGLTMIFIAHDLAVVKNISDRVAVMYLGRLCEVGDPDVLYDHPAHPYTAALLGAIPVPDPSIRPEDRHVLGGEIPSPVSPPSGCRFRTRCPKADDMCVNEVPEMRLVEGTDDHYIACHHPLAEGETLTPVEIDGVAV